MHIQEKKAFAVLCALSDIRLKIEDQTFKTQYLSALPYNLYNLNKEKSKKNYIS